MSATDVEDHRTRQAIANLKMQIATIIAKRKDTLLEFVTVDSGNRKQNKYISRQRRARQNSKMLMTCTCCSEHPETNQSLSK